MRTIAFLTQKGGAGKTTLAASLAAVAVNAGERVIALDLDPQASLLRWGQYRQAANAPNKVVIEPIESERLSHLHAILEGLADVGFTVAIFDTAGSDNAAARLVTEAADICLLPTRPTRLDVAATAATFRAVFLAKRKAAFVLNQCPPNFRSSRTSDAAKDLTSLGVLAEAMLSTRMDFQDAMARGLGVTEYARQSRAAHEVEALWAWTRAQLEGSPLVAEHLCQQRPLSALSCLRTREHLTADKVEKLIETVKQNATAIASSSSNKRRR